MFKNISFQIEDFLKNCPETLYSQNISPQSGTIGAHTRHILDHIDAFIKGCSEYTVNYDIRERDTLTEKDPKAALSRIKKINENIHSINAKCIHTERPLKLAAMTDTNGSFVNIASNLEREFLFIISHTVHHMALIRNLCTQSEFFLNENFGKASSTLYKERTQRSC
ncbi:MAG: hypothetical protein R3A80_09670 [Bdellovibrionota bacterium]